MPDVLPNIYNVRPNPPPTTLFLGIEILQEMGRGEAGEGAGEMGLSSLKGTWQRGGFSGVFAEIGSSRVPYSKFRAIPIFASNSRRYS